MHRAPWTGPTTGKFFDASPVTSPSTGLKKPPCNCRSTVSDIWLEIISMDFSANNFFVRSLIVSLFFSFLFRFFLNSRDEAEATNEFLTFEGGFLFFFFLRAPMNF